MSTRREFFKRALTGSAAVAGAAVCPPVQARSNAQISPDAVGLLFDSTLCVGCKACVAACKRENNLPLDYNTPDDSPWDLPLVSGPDTAWPSRISSFGITAATFASRARRGVGRA